MLPRVCILKIKTKILVVDARIRVNADGVRS